MPTQKTNLFCQFLVDTEKINKDINEVITSFFFFHLSVLQSLKG